MNKKSTTTSTELKHYIRANSRATERELIVERVSTGSASFDFLKKMEARRKKHICVRTIDMRGKVPYECKSYVHKNQVFWMDDISYGIFLKGLRENNDVFTNEMFEAIVNGNHTNHKNKQATNNALTDIKKKTSAAFQENGNTDSSFDEERFRVEGKDADIFHLGYYQKRGESRLKHATDILIHTADDTIGAKTKDISATGFKASFQKPANLKAGDEIAVTYTGFNNTFKSNLVKVQYQVVHMTYDEPDFILCVRNVDSDSTATQFIADFINDQQQNIKGRRKLDIEDTRLTAESLMTELNYTNTTPTVPFFISAANADLHLQTICVNNINKPMIQCFRNSNDSFDFTNFSDHSRIKKLFDIVQDDGQRDPLLAVYLNDSGSPKVMLDYEFESYDLWETFIAGKLNEKNLTLFKVVVRSVAKPDQRKLDQKIEKLKTKSETSVDDMLNYYNHISKAGVLVDITSELSNTLKNKKLDFDMLKSTNAFSINFAELSGNDVEILQFGYTEQRREDRYHVSVDAIVHLNTRKYKAVTKDISIKGLCVELSTTNQEGYKKGDEVMVDFPVLHKRAKERIKLIDMPYTITCIHYENGKPILHFKREKTKHWNEQTTFFKDMIDRNINLIKLDTKDIETATKSKLIASLAVENTATLPIFILKNPEGGSKTASMALPPQPGDLMDFFEVEPGKYDFKPITHPNRLSSLSNNVKNNQVSDLIIYMYKKQIPGIAKFTIYSALETEFTSSEERKLFMETFMEHDYCVIKIAVSQVQKPMDTEVVSAVEQLQDVAPHGVQRLINTFNNIVAIGDITDITNQMIENI